MTCSKLPLHIAQEKVNGLTGRLKQQFRLVAPSWDTKGMPARGRRAEPARRAGQDFGVNLAGAGAKSPVNTPP